MSLLGSLGVLSYNGVNLNPPEACITKITSRPVPDSSGRTVKFVNLTINLHTVVYTTPPLTTDGTILAIRQNLSAYGGAFVLSGKGCGDIIVNVKGQPGRDVNYGPRPQIISLKSAGAQYAWNLDFEIVIAMPECTSAKFANVLMEANYDLTFEVDKSAYSKRIFKGHIEIPATRDLAGGAGIQDNVDNYFDQFVPAAINGFRRVSNTRSLNEAKTRLDINIVDEEMPLNYPPPGVVDITADNSYSNASPLDFVSYTGTLNFDYEMEKGADPNIARDHFFKVWNDRRQAIADSLNSGGLLKNIYPISFSCSEPSIYGKVHCKFTLQYAIVLQSKPGTFLTAGLWRPMPDSDWSKWSAANGAIKTNRGAAGLFFSNSDDAIIDLCTNAPQEQALKNNKKISPARLQGAAIFNSPNPAPPDPANSFLAYYCSICYETLDSAISQIPLPGQPSAAFNAASNLIAATMFQKTAFNPPSDPSLPQNILHKRAGSQVSVILSGYAARVGYGVVPPQLMGIGNMPALPANRSGDGFIQRIIGNCEFPVYVGQWRLRYLLPSAPALILAPLNPLFLQSTIQSAVVNKLTGTKN